MQVMEQCQLLLNTGKAVSQVAGCALLNGVTDDVVRQANNYSAQHVAVTCWAFAKLEITPRPNLMQVNLTPYSDIMHA